MPVTAEILSQFRRGWPQDGEQMWIDGEDD